MERYGLLRLGAIHVVTCTGFVFFQEGFLALLTRFMGPYSMQKMTLGEALWDSVTKSAFLDTMVYVMTVGVLLAIDLRRKLRAQELTGARLQAELAKAELDALRVQLHPHFLFNTLNAISMLVRKGEGDTAVRMIAGLSDLLRLALATAGQQEVPLRQELDFLERYLCLQQMPLPGSSADRDEDRSRHARCARPEPGAAAARGERRAASASRRPSPVARWRWPRCARARSWSSACAIPASACNRGPSLPEASACATSASDCSTCTLESTASAWRTGWRAASSRCSRFLSVVRRWCVPEPVTVAVVDDEPLAREGLRMLLAEDPEVKVVGEAGSGDEAVALLARTHPQLCFLDVQMPGGSGFEVLARAEAPLPMVVFVTAYDQYALEAFRVHAFDYLLKPYEDARFRETLSRAKEQLSREEAARLGEQLRAKAVEAGLVPATSSRIVVRDRGRIIFLEAEEIDWIESADYYVELHVGARTYLHRESMAALENRLDSGRFVRIHRTAIVNRRVLRELRRTGSGGLVAVLATGAELPVARSQQARIRQLR